MKALVGILTALVAIGAPGSKGTFAQACNHVYPGYEYFVGSCGVPSYSDIQSAVDAAADGDTITVCPGTYSQSVQVTKEVRIRAAMAGSVSVHTTGTSFDIQRSGVEIGGLTIQSDTGAGVSANSICPLSQPSCATPSAGSNLVITNNTIQNSPVGITWQRRIDCASITDNTMSANGVHIELQQQEDAPAVLVSIVNNVITGGGQSGAAVSLSGLGAIFAVNTIANSTNAGLVLANVPGSGGTEIVENTFSDNAGDGITVRPGADGAAIHDNNIMDNGVGLGNDSNAGTLDATLNWWGSPSGPSGVFTGAGDQIVNRAGGTTTLVEFLCDPFPLGFPSATGTCNASAVISPTSLSFGPVPMGTAVDETVQLHNTGTRVLTVGSVSSPFILPSGTPTRIYPGDTTTVSIRFLSPVAGAFQDTLHLSDDISVPLRGLAFSSTPPDRRPRITQVAPKLGVPGDTIVLRGKRFGAVPGGPGSLTVGPFDLTPAVWSDSYIRLTIPSLPPGLIHVFVRTEAGGDSAVLKILAPSPLIQKLSPNAAPPGSTVFLEGANFGAQQGASTISLGGTDVSIASWSDKRVGFTVPNVAFGRYPLVLTAPGGQAKKSLLVRAQSVVTQYGLCDDLVAGDCHALVVSTSRISQQGADVVADVVIENIRPRWYDLVLSPVGAAVPETAVIIAPGARKILPGVVFHPGGSIALFADGQSDRAFRWYAVDLTFLAATGKHIPITLIEDAEVLIGAASPLAGFFSKLAVLAQEGDIVAIAIHLATLPALATDPTILALLQTTLGLTDAQIQGLGTLKNIVHLTSVIQENLFVLTSPRFDTMTLTVQ